MSQPNKDSIYGHYTNKGFLLPKSSKTEIVETPPLLGEPPQTPFTGNHRKRTIKGTSQIPIFPPLPAQCNPPNYPRTISNQRKASPPKKWTPKFVFVRIKHSIIPLTKIDFEAYPCNNPPPLPPEEDDDDDGEIPPPPPPEEEEEEYEEEIPPPPPSSPPPFSGDEEELSPPPPPPPPEYEEEYEDDDEIPSPPPEYENE